MCIRDSTCNKRRCTYCTGKQFSRIDLFPVFHLSKHSHIDQIEGKENGSYVVLSKFDDDVIFEYHITVMDDEFNLGVLTMRTPEGVFETDFDA